MLRWRQEAITTATLVQQTFWCPTGKPAAFDLSVSSSLNSKVFLEAGLSGGVAARVTQQAIMQSARNWVGSEPHGSTVLGG